MTLRRRTSNVIEFGNVQFEFSTNEPIKKQQINKQKRSNIMKLNSLKLALIVFTLSSLFLIGCQKKEDNPTGPGDGGNTQTGAGTMSAKIDNVNWSASAIPGSPIPAAYADFSVSGSQSVLQIMGTQISGSTASTILISLNNVRSTGEYSLGVPGLNYFGYGVVSYSDGSAYGTAYQPGQDQYTGKVTITKFDETNKIVSGTFYFTAKAASGNATGEKRITEGKFDVKWGIFN